MTEIDWTQYTDEEIREVLNEGNDELVRRDRMNVIPEQMESLNKEYLGAAGVAEGEAWVQPTGAHDAYPLDWLVTHEGTSWISLVSGNVWEPGVSGWREDSGEEWPAWVQPTGAHDAYAVGAKVSHVQKHWSSLVDANTWEPGAAGSEALWQEQP